MDPSVIQMEGFLRPVVRHEAQSNECLPSGGLWSPQHHSPYRPDNPQFLEASELFSMYHSGAETAHAPAPYDSPRLQLGVHGWHQSPICYARLQVYIPKVSVEQSRHSDQMPLFAPSSGDLEHTSTPAYQHGKPHKSQTGKRLLEFFQKSKHAFRRVIGCQTTSSTPNHGFSVRGLPVPSDCSVYPPHLGKPAQVPYSLQSSTSELYAPVGYSSVGYSPAGSSELAGDPSMESSLTQSRSETCYSTEGSLSPTSIILVGANIELEDTTPRCSTNAAQPLNDAWHTTKDVASCMASSNSIARPEQFEYNHDPESDLRGVGAQTSVSLISYNNAYVGNLAISPASERPPTQYPGFPTTPTLQPGTAQQYDLILPNYAMQDGLYNDLNSLDSSRGEEHQSGILMPSGMVSSQTRRPDAYQILGDSAFISATPRSISPPTTMVETLASVSSPTVSVTGSQTQSISPAEELKCDICGYKPEGKPAKRKTNLKKHAKNKHTEKEPTCCSYCPTEFKRHDNIYNHHKKFHPDAEPLPCKRGRPKSKGSVTSASKRRKL